MYYAEYRPNNDSVWFDDPPALFRFDTKRERDEWVSENNRLIVKDEWFPISSKDAATRYDLSGFDNLDSRIFGICPIA